MDEEKIIIAMARADCIADDEDPDEIVGEKHDGTPMHKWEGCSYGSARRMFFMYKALVLASSGIDWPHWQGAPE